MTEAETGPDEDGARGLEKGRLLFAKACDFVLGAAELSGIPPGTLTEVAFAGRSNAGKSSLVNALTGRKTLARVSNTPGRTRQINFFSLDARLMLADLPGYGFARASKTDTAQWTALVFDYLRGRPNLRRAMLLIDSRRGPMPVDIETMTLLDRAAVSYQLVLTKTDQLKPAKLAEIEALTLEECRRHVAAYPEILATSSLSGKGIPEMRAALAALTERG
jgi:GTP-binding protein